MKPLILVDEKETPVIAKTRELCATILSQPAYAQMKQSIMDFMENDDARILYENLCDKQEELHQKHSQGMPITEEEDAEFEAMEKRFMAMPVASAFINTQRQMQKIEKTVAKYVRKTFELGRVPSESDFSSGGGCCGGSSGGGGGCGCG